MGCWMSWPLFWSGSSGTAAAVLVSNAGRCCCWGGGGGGLLAGGGAGLALLSLTPPRPRLTLVLALFSTLILRASRSGRSTSPSS